MPINDRPGKASSLLNYLPTIFQDGSTPDRPNLLGRFLLAFERILLGFGEDSEELEEPGFGLEDKIAKLDRYFDPERTPSEFLPWLASWVALTLRDDWKEEEKRRFIGRIVPLYQQRGTKSGLEKLLRAYTGLPKESVRVYELTQPLQVGKTSTVGVDTAIGSGPPHYFVVKMSLPVSTAIDRSRRKQIASAIIDREKPAHTYYDLIVEFPTIQVGITSTVGKDTLIGTPR
jgi:phage tail-like protein